MDRAGEEKTQAKEMNLFEKVFKDPLEVKEVKDGLEGDYNLICKQMGRLANKLYINKELLSQKWWSFLTEKYEIKNEQKVITKSEITLDEKRRQQCFYKYYVKLNEDLWFIFFDEKKNLDEEDYYDYANEEDKANKVSGLHIFYNSDRYTTQEIEEEILKPVENFMYIPSKKNQFFTMSIGASGFELITSYLSEINLDLSLNYEDNFEQTHEQIVERLNQEKYGLVILNGEKGSGKTTYLRKLISSLGEDKTLIYVPSYMLEYITTSDFMSFISRFKNCILLLEDAEIILSKNNENKKALANILNLTDGLLNDNLEIKIVITFNVDKSEISPLIFKTSKLIINHSFEKIPPQKANRLAQNLGNGKTFQGPVLVGEIYGNVINLQNKTKIGFKRP
jgi:hypothetical protein